MLNKVGTRANETVEKTYYWLTWAIFVFIFPHTETNDWRRGLVPNPQQIGREIESLVRRLPKHLEYCVGANSDVNPSKQLGTDKHFTNGIIPEVMLRDLISVNFQSLLWWRFMQRSFRETQIIWLWALMITPGSINTIWNSGKKNNVLTRVNFRLKYILIWMHIVQESSKSHLFAGPVTHQRIAHHLRRAQFPLLDLNWDRFSRNKWL